MSSVPAISSEEFELLYDIWLTRLCQLSASLAVLYDHLISIDQEVELIWKQKWSMTKVLYIWIRYFGDCLMIFNASTFLSSVKSDNFCYHFFRIQGFGGTCVVFAMQIILQFRIWAMYLKSRKIAIFTGVCFVVEAIAVLIILARAYALTGTVASPLPGVYLCTLTNIPRFFYSFWIPFIAFEAMLCCLAGWVGIRDMMGVRVKGRILRIMLRDSMLYFGVIFIIYTITAVMWLLPHKAWLEIPEGFTTGLTIIMGSRLVLNLRDAYSAPFNPELTTITVDSPWASPESSAQTASSREKNYRWLHRIATPTLPYSGSNDDIPLHHISIQEDFGELSTGI